MRVIKMTASDPEVDTKEKAIRFLGRDIHGLEYQGKFHITERKLARDGLSPGERLVFTYSGELIFIGVAETGRMDTESSDRWSKQYPYYFKVSLASLIRASGRVLQLEDRLQTAGLTDKSIAQSQGWPSVPDSAEVDRIVQSFAV